MMAITAAVAWCLMCCGLTALFVSLAWFRVLDEARDDAACLGEALLDEIAAHRHTQAAHAACCDDLRKAGISGAMRKTLRVVR